AVRERVLGLCHGGGTDQRERPADRHPDRVVPQRQRPGRPAERRQGPGLRHDRHHRGRHGHLRGAAAEGRAMAAVIGDEMVEGIAPEPTRRANAGWRRLPIWRWVILLVVGAYFIIPLVAALRFTGFSAFPAVFDQEGFSAAFELSVRLALITTVATLVLMPPTTIYVHLRMPRLRRLMEGVKILPIGIPPVGLFVTHDQEEALSMADRVGVMRDGTLEQIASPSELYAHPATASEAEFVGIMNRIPSE